MNFLKQVIKDGLFYLATMLVVILCACILGIPIFIGLMINSVPLVLFGILFFSAFGTAIAKYGIERQIKNVRTWGFKKV